MKLVLLILCFLPYFVFVIYLWKVRENVYNLKIDREGIGLARDAVCCDEKVDANCVLCNKWIYQHMDRYVNYENEEKLCYPCWKEENFVNVRHRLFIYDPDDLLLPEIKYIIQRFMLDDYWEICAYERLFPEKLENLLIPIYKRQPTLDIPIQIIDDHILKWLLRGSMHYIFLDTGFNNDLYRLCLYNPKTRQRYPISRNTGDTESDKRDTFLLINRLQDMTIEKILELDIFLYT